MGWGWGHASPQLGEHSNKWLWGLTLIEPASWSGIGVWLTMKVSSSPRTTSDSPSVSSVKSTREMSLPCLSFRTPRVAALFPESAVVESPSQTYDSCRRYLCLPMTINFPLCLQWRRTGKYLGPLGGMATGGMEVLDLRALLLGRFRLLWLCG